MPIQLATGDHLRPHLRTTSAAEQFHGAASFPEGRQPGSIPMPSPSPVTPVVSALRGDPPPTPRDLARALRYADRSVVIDLSHLPQDEKIEYMGAALPALNEMRRRTGLPRARAA
jgi:hypothetical protein